MEHTKFRGKSACWFWRRIFFKGFLPYMGMAAILVKIVSEEIQFEFLYVHDLGPRSRNDLDL